MSNTFSNILVLSASVLLVGACTKADGDMPMTEAEFCQEYAKRECAAVAPLCGYAPASCEPTRVVDCRTRAGLWKTGVGGSTRPFLPGNAPACLDKINTTYATLPITGAALRTLQDTCARVFQGTAKVTETCAVDADCENALICDKAKSRCGEKKQVTAGAGCANIGELCPVDEYCKPVSGTFLCSKRAVKGAACSAAEPCVPSQRCMGTCVDLMAVGMPCALDDECTSNYCNPYTKACGVGLNFADGSDSCDAYRGSATGADASAD